MTSLWRLIGHWLFWITWPALWIYLHGSQRTRVAVIYEGQILVAKRWLDDGRWSLPGGGRHRRETALAGARRELREETGLLIDEDELIHLSHELFSSHGLSFTFDLFALNLSEKPLIDRRAAELTEIRWINPAELTPDNSGSDVMAALRRWPA